MKYLDLQSIQKRENINFYETFAWSHLHIVLYKLLYSQPSNNDFSASSAHYNSLFAFHYKVWSDFSHFLALYLNSLIHFSYLRLT